MNKQLWTPRGVVIVKAKVGFQPPMNKVVVKEVRRMDPERERALRGA